MLPTPTTHFGVVVPLKPAAVAKSRLSAVGDAVRRELVAAFAVDTVTAAMACPLVSLLLVVTDDLDLAMRLRGVGARTIPDGAPGRLNQGLRLGAAELHRLDPAARPVALCADLPALRSAELTSALRQAPAELAAYVPDAAGIGTTLYAAPGTDRFRPQFGPRSRAAHAAAGAVELVLDPASSVRRDVDTPADLHAAVRLGVGPETSRVLRQLAPDPA